MRPRNVSLRPRASSTSTVTSQPCNLVRIVFALIDRAFDVHRVQAEQLQDRVARVHPLVLLACELFDDAVERRRDDAALDRQLGRVQLGLLRDSIRTWRALDRAWLSRSPASARPIRACAWRTLDFGDRSFGQPICFLELFRSRPWRRRLAPSAKRISTSSLRTLDGRIHGVAGGLLLHLRLAVVDLADLSGPA